MKMKIITTKYGIWMDDDEVIYHTAIMRAGTYEAECACDTCELLAAIHAGGRFVLLEDGGYGLRLIFDASQGDPFI